MSAARMLAVKVDVDTLRGTRQGLRPLMEALNKRKADATFLFSLGPDHTGRAIKRVFRPGFLGKVKRTSVASNYGLATLLYGTLLPGPDIGRRCAAEMRAVREGGFEAGIHCWDHVRWQDGVEHADADWTEREMGLAFRRFEEVFGFPAKTHGAAGWQLNRHAAWFEENNFQYASDTRGFCPFLPCWNGVAIGCPQLPTTLPTLDELVGRDGIDASNVAERVLALSGEAPVHVFTAHAELEGGAFVRAFDRLLEGWDAQGFDIVSLATLYDSIDRAALPRHDVVYGEAPGRSGRLALQAREAA